MYQGLRRKPLAPRILFGRPVVISPVPTPFPACIPSGARGCPNASCTGDGSMVGGEGDTGAVSPSEIPWPKQERRGATLSPCPSGGLAALSGRGGRSLFSRASSPGMRFPQGRASARRQVVQTTGCPTAGTSAQLLIAQHVSRLQATAPPSSTLASTGVDARGRRDNHRAPYGRRTVKQVQER